MSKMSHTPGPWTLTADPLHFYSLTTVIGGKENHQKNGPPQQMIVQVGGFAEWKEAEANARLIAAAPELLEASMKVLEWFEAEDDHSKADFYQRIQMCSDAEEMIRAAIAKATGGAA